MTIELTKNTLGVWTVSLPAQQFGKHTGGGDWLCAAWAEGEKYIIEYRFRYYLDDKAFDSEDIKNWYRMEIQKDGATEDKIIEVVRALVKKLWIDGGGKRYEVLMDDSGVDGLLREMKKWPSISMKKVDEVD